MGLLPVGDVIASFTSSLDKPHLNKFSLYSKQTDIFKTMVSYVTGTNKINVPGTEDSLLENKISKEGATFQRAEVTGGVPGWLSQ